MTDGLQVGDVALDLAQGRPVHVVEDTGLTAAEWSEANDYDLVGNYGNSRLDTEPEDRVYEVVFCSSLKSKPSKTYAMPESRLGRVETEAADDGRPVYDRVVRDVLERVFTVAFEEGTPQGHEGEWLAEQLPEEFGPDLTNEAYELADVEQTIGGDDAE